MGWRREATILNRMVRLREKLRVDQGLEGGEK